MTEYEKLLRSPEWKRKRDSIVARDKSTCTNCGNVHLFDRSILCSVFTNQTTNVWQVIRVKELLGETSYKLFVPVEGSELLIRGDLVLVTPFQSVKEGLSKTAFLIACKNQTEKDLLIQVLKSRIGKKDERFIQAVGLYKASIHNEWKQIKGLEVHHKYYQHGTLPWEYPDEALTTLCEPCHELLHANGKVSVLDKYGKVIEEYTNCSRCHGAGWFPEYSHVQAGICFECNGAKFKELLTSN